MHVRRILCCDGGTLSLCMVSAVQNVYCKCVASNQQAYTCATAAAYTGGKLNSFSTAAESREERPVPAAAGAVAEHLGNEGCLCLGFPPRAYISACAYVSPYNPTGASRFRDL